MTMALEQRVAGKLARIWDRVQPKRTVAGTIVPLRRDTTDLIHWAPNWKTQIIGAALGQRPGVFIDVGINIGQTLLDYRAAPIRNGYIGFEPNSRCVERTQSIIDAAGLDDCEIVPVGLADSNAVISLFVSEGAPLDAGATMVPSLRPGDKTTALHVPVFKFDDLAPTIVRDRPISLIKIDVEGGELRVLKGMVHTLRKARPLIQCEVLTRYFADDTDAHAARCRELMLLLHDADYRVLRVEKDRHEGILVGYTEVDGFAEEIHTHENKHLCDFVFVPSEQDWPV